MRFTALIYTGCPNMQVQILCFHVTYSIDIPAVLSYFENVILICPVWDLEDISQGVFEVTVSETTITEAVISFAGETKNEFVSPLCQKEIDNQPKSILPYNHTTIITQLTHKFLG